MAMRDWLKTSLVVALFLLAILLLIAAKVLLEDGSYGRPLLINLGTGTLLYLALSRWTQVALSNPRPRPKTVEAIAHWR
jgi:hypothetical protein